jgi:curved DNA-binding protein CbpA
MKKIDYYRRLLDVTKNTELKELKSVYRNLMKDWHPDKFQANETEKLAAEEKSKKIIEAYHFLVSIAPETIAASIEQYTETITVASIEDFEYKNEMLSITFSDGNSYEYFGVPKATYVKLVNAPSQARFARRHICNSFVYRSVNKLVAA